MSRRMSEDLAQGVLLMAVEIRWSRCRCHGIPSLRRGGPVSVPLEATVARADRTPPPTLLSGPPAIRHVAKGIAGRNEVISPCQRPRICGERVARPACRADHALQHCREGALVSAEADEHGPVVGDRAIGHVPTEDLSEEVLVGPCDVRIEWFVGEFETVEFRTPDHPLLLGY